jgi:hypothetical protein
MIFVHTHYSYTTEYKKQSHQTTFTGMTFQFKVPRKTGNTTTITTGIDNQTKQKNGANRPNR